MPTVIFISKKDNNSQNISLEEAAKRIGASVNQSLFLVNCGCEVFFQPDYQTVAIHILTVYSFDAHVTGRIIKHINEYLETIGLRNFFYASGSATTPKKLTPDDFIPSAYKNQNIVPNFTITLQYKNQGLGLYRDDRRIANQISSIADEIKTLMSQQQLRIDRRYDYDNKEYKLDFINLNMPSENDLLHFMGNIVMKAIHKKGFEQDYKIVEFDQKKYDNLCRSMQSTTLLDKTRAEQSLNLTEEDKALYGEELYGEYLSNHNNKSNSKIKSHSSRFGSPTTITGYIHERVIQIINKKLENENIKDFEPFLKALSEMNYPKAVRNICNSSKPIALSLLETILHYKDPLNFFIDEQAGEKKRAAIHYAALQGNKEIYDLLIQKGANCKIEDGDGHSAEYYMSKYPSKPAIQMH